MKCKVRLAALILALALTLTACGGNPTPASDSTSDTPLTGESIGTQLPEGALVIAEQGMFSSGGTVTEPDAQIEQGIIESSNVNVVSEMVEMISVSRAYQAGQKMINAIDETLGKAVNEVGKI